MGLHTDTEIHKTAYDLFGVVIAASRNMPRDVKLLMGGKMRDEVLEVFDDIYEANVSRDKLPHLDRVRRRMQKIEIMLRRSRDLRFIPTSHYAAAVLLTQSIGKQATAWRKYSATHPPVA